MAPRAGATSCAIPPKKNRPREHALSGLASDASGPHLPKQKLHGGSEDRTGG